MNLIFFECKRLVVIAIVLLCFLRNVGMDYSQFIITIYEPIRHASVMTCHNKFFPPQHTIKIKATN